MWKLDFLVLGSRISYLEGWIRTRPATDPNLHLVNNYFSEIGFPAIFFYFFHYEFGNRSIEIEEYQDSLKKTTAESGSRRSKGNGSRTTGWNVFTKIYLTLISSSSSSSLVFLIDCKLLPPIGTWNEQKLQKTLVNYGTLDPLFHLMKEKIYLMCFPKA